MPSLDKIEPLDLSKVFKETFPRNEKKKPRKGLGLRVYEWFCVKHLFISSLLLIWTFAGAFAIWMVENPAEQRKLKADLTTLESELDAIYDDLIQNRTNLNDNNTMESLLKEIYVRMEKKENIFVGSAIHKNESSENMMWRFWPATFYAANIYMTVGYGAIHCFTSWGQFLSIVYGFISIPFSLVVLRDLSQWVLVVLTRFYGRVVLRWRKDHGIETDPNEEFAFPIKLIVLLWIANWLFVATCTWLYDAFWALKWEERGAESQSFFGSFYYSFITITSMGMSDDMPVYSSTSPLHSLWHFLALPIYKMGNRIVYISMENGILGTLAVLEYKLSKQKREVKDVSTIEEIPPTSPTRSAPRITRAKTIEEEEFDEEERLRIGANVQSFTVGSIKSFMESQADAYAGDFGRVRLSRDSID